MEPSQPSQPTFNHTGLGEDYLFGTKGEGVRIYRGFFGKIAGLFQKMKGNTCNVKIGHETAWVKISSFEKHFNKNRETVQKNQEAITQIIQQIYPSNIKKMVDEIKQLIKKLQEKNGIDHDLFEFIDYLCIDAEVISKKPISQEDGFELKNLQDSLRYIKDQLRSKKSRMKTNNFNIKSVINDTSLGLADRISMVKLEAYQENKYLKYDLPAKFIDTNFLKEIIPDTPDNILEMEYPIIDFSQGTLDDLIRTSINKKLTNNSN